MNQPHVRNWIVSGLLITFACCSLAQAEPTEKSVPAPDGLTVSIKMIGPVTQTTDLQIVCMLKHDPAGDKYIDAVRDFNDKLKGLIESLRNRGEFIGETGETLLFTPPPESISPRRVLLIGVGDEASLTIDRLKLAGTIAAREAVRLHVSSASFAPMLRDQGSTRIDVGEGDAAVVDSFLLAYDTEYRLAAEQLNPPTELKELVIEAGSKFFDAATEKVSAAIKTAGKEIDARLKTPLIMK